MGLFRPYTPGSSTSGSGSDANDAAAKKRTSLVTSTGTPSSPVSSSPASPSTATPPPAPASSPAKSATSTTTIDRPSASGTDQRIRQKKTAPTPTRRQAEEARRQRLTPTLTKKEQKAKEREARYKARDEAMERVNAKPANTMVRDYVDGRWGVAEFVMPIMLLIFVAMFITMRWMMAQIVVMIVTYGVFFLLIIDTVVMWLGCRKALQKYFPGELKGKFWYAMSRSMLFRRARIPQPRVKRGTTKHGSRFVWPPQETIGAPA
ncbi:MAG: DUF3043 domain-containing protein [Propionibacteriaceae bacterium]|nr:DUF3043 domain-containing protein [Propionibacteriaceae bacterium]